jgi:DNA-binding NarL/FixJ family response regulator
MAEAEPQDPTISDERIRVMVVDDHEIWRDGLRAHLQEDIGAVVVAETSDGGPAIDLAREAMPDVVVMDIKLPVVDGVVATRRIVEQIPHAKVLIVSVSGERADVLEAIKAGAVGYVLKSEPASLIADAVRRVHHGEPFISASLAGMVLAEFRKLAGPDPTDSLLTERENEILRLVAQGYKYREIAQQLFIATKTVQNHVQNILTKLQMHNRYELLRYAIQQGLDRRPD